MSVLSVIQDFAGQKGLPVPPGVVGVPEASTRQLWILLKQAVEELAKKDWQVLASREVWTSVAGPDQGRLVDLFPTGQYERIVARTFWNVTQRYPMSGPMSAVQWQQAKATPAVGPIGSYYIMGGRLYVWPDLPAGETLSAIISTGLLVIGADGTLKEVPTADDDVFRISEGVVRRELEWRWLKEKGEPWQASWDAAQEAQSFELLRETMPVLSLEMRKQAIRPGIVVPAGSWHVP